MRGKWPEPKCGNKYPSADLQWFLCLHKEKYHIFPNTCAVWQSGIFLSILWSKRGGWFTSFYCSKENKGLWEKEGSRPACKPTLSPVTAMACGTEGLPQRGEQQLWWPLSFGWFPIAEFHILKWALRCNNNPYCSCSPRALYLSLGVGKAIMHNKLPLLQSVSYYVPLRLPSVSRDFLSRLETL